MPEYTITSYNYIIFFEIYYCEDIFSNSQCGRISVGCQVDFSLVLPIMQMKVRHIFCSNIWSSSFLTAVACQSSQWHICEFLELPCVREAGSDGFDTCLWLLASASFSCEALETAEGGIGTGPCHPHGSPGWNFCFASLISVWPLVHAWGIAGINN